MAERALQGVGDARLGEWREQGQRAVHLRRRLSDDERAAAGDLGVRDIRGTEEERDRYRALLRDAPHLRGLVTAPKMTPPTSAVQTDSPLHGTQGKDQR